MSITAQQVKELRERTGGRMMECKNALVEANGDIEKAIDLMRKAGAARADKRASKIAAEGAVVSKVSSDARLALIMEVNCETDFVALGDQFKAFCEHLVDLGLNARVASVADLAKLPYGDDKTVEQARQSLVAKMGENIQIRRLTLLQAQGSIAQYHHGNRIGVLVDCSSEDASLSKDIAMQVAASKPLVIQPDQLPAELLDKERDIYSAQVADSGKPPEIIEKMVTGRMRKYLAEVSLVQQPYIKEPKQTVGDLLKAAHAEVFSFARYEVGEGIEKQTIDFAEEVMAQVRD